MFQREVAERIVAQPGSKAYGRLAILAQWRADAQALCCRFRPAPLLRRPRSPAPWCIWTPCPSPGFEADAAILSRVVAAAFNQRRKMLRASLKGVSPSD